MLGGSVGFLFGGYMINPKIDDWRFCNVKAGDKIKASQISQTRADFLQQQQYKCGLCGLDCTDDPVLDHNQKEGFLREVLHRQCNALLGRIENNAPRHLVPLEELAQFLRNAANYLDKHKSNQSGLLHPTYFTTEEKKERAKIRAKKKRLKLKTIEK
jgi:hypothetical protein